MDQMKREGAQGLFATTTIFYLHPPNHIKGKSPPSDTTPDPPAPAVDKYVLCKPIFVCRFDSQLAT